MISSMARYINSTSIRKKVYNKESFISNSSSDTINDLPEHLVSHILSLLPTKETIKTSILSKRWRFLWTSISNLDISDDNIDDDIFYDKYGNYDDKGNNGVCINFFTDYVDRVMLALEPTSIDKFSIILDKYTDVFHINKWISAAVVRNVRDLTLSLGSFIDNPIDVPCNVFHCKTLEVLRLDEGAVFNIPKQESVCFPNLKFLSLDGVDICGIPAEEGSVCFPKLQTLRLLCVHYVGNDDNVMKLMRNCPVLEDLFIRRFVIDNIPNTDMCIPALRNAELCFPCDSIGCRSVEIDTPIKYLKLINWSPSHKVLVKKTDSLIEAELTIIDYKSAYYQGEQRDEVFKLMKAVDKVKCLALSCDTVDAIKDSNIVLPLFCNLVRLEVTLNCKDLCMLQCLLNNSINLQTLVINKKHSPCRIKDTRWTELSPVPKCLLTSVKRVEIRCFNGCADEVAMIKNMLKCANILKRLTTKRSFFDKGDILKKSSLREEILMFPRASAGCEVEFL